MNPPVHPPRHSEVKLQLILHHAALVFAEKGFEGASVRDISRASGVSLAGLYYYFESKQKILYRIQVEAFSSLLQGLQARLGHQAQPVERLRELVANHVAYFLSHPAETKVLAHEEDALEEPFRKEVAEIKRRYYQLSREVLHGLPRNSQRHDRMNDRVAVLSLFGMMNWIYKWYNPKVDPPADRLADMISSMFLQGVMDGQGTRSSNAVSRRHSEPDTGLQAVQYPLES